MHNVETELLLIATQKMRTRTKDTYSNCQRTVKSWGPQLSKVCYVTNWKEANASPILKKMSHARVKLEQISHDAHANYKKMSTNSSWIGPAKAQPVLTKIWSEQRVCSNIQNKPKNNTTRCSVLQSKTWYFSHKMKLIQSKYQNWKSKSTTWDVPKWWFTMKL